MYLAGVFLILPSFSLSCSSQKLEDEVSNVAGNVFVAAACVAYCGAFTSSYRERVSLVFMVLNLVVPFPLSFSFLPPFFLLLSIPFSHSHACTFLCFLLSPSSSLGLPSTLSFLLPLPFSFLTVSLPLLFPRSSSISGSSTAKNYRSPSLKTLA